MKKICILGVGLATCFATFAQVDLVKDVEHQLKSSNPDYVSALKAIQPALTNPATENNVATWMTAAQAAFGCYDNVFDAVALNQNPDKAVIIQGANALIDGYNYYFKALQLDSLPNEKGKIKPKESKKILKTLAGYYPQLRNAGAFLYDAQALDDAFNAWEMYVQLPSMPSLAKAKVVEDADSVVGQILFYQAICKLQNGVNDVALAKFNDAIDHNYNNLYTYVYGLEAARRIDDADAMARIAQLGYDKFGTEDISFIGQLINKKLKDNDITAANALVDEALANTPADNVSMISQLWGVKGYVQEWNEDREGAKKCYAEAIAIDPTNAKATFDLGRMYYNEAVTIQGENDEPLPEFVSLSLQAADLFKKAYSLDQSVGDGNVAALLWRLYYALGADYVEDAKEWEALQ